MTRRGGGPPFGKLIGFRGGARGGAGRGGGLALGGGSVVGLSDAIRPRAPRIRHVPMRDERHAAYAADGYARVSGRVGVCDATVGPGAIKFTSGLAEGLNSSIPLFALFTPIFIHFLPP